MSSWRDKRRREVMSKEEARDIFADEAKAKDFWCADYFDNRDRLQEAVDLIYNAVEGNSYVVDYQENQNGTRLVVRCEICSKDLSSLDPFLSHENGKAHNKVRQQVLTPKNPNLQHELRLRPLNYYKGIFPKDSLEDLIDNYTGIVLGIQFVYKEVVSGKDRYTCQLCRMNSDCISTRTSEMFSHVKSSAHNRKYLQVKFGRYKMSTSEYEDYAQWMVEREGKIHGLIIDFTMHLIVKVKPELVSSNYEPLGKRIVKQRIETPSSTRQQRSGTKSPKDKSKRHRDRSRSRSCSLIRDASGSNAWERGPPSPDLFNSRKETLLHQLPPPVPNKPVMRDVGITVDMSDQARHIITSLNVLSRRDALDVITADIEMQELLHETLWALNMKLDKFFAYTKTMCFNEKYQPHIVGTAATEKLMKHLKDLEVIKLARNSSFSSPR